MPDRDLLNRMNAASKAAYERDARIHEVPVTKKELRAREALRSIPKPENTLTPEGSVTQTVNTEVNAENERRINFIRKRLARQAGKLNRDFQHKP